MPVGNNSGKIEIFPLGHSLVPVSGTVGGSSDIIPSYGFLGGNGDIKIEGS